MRAGQAKSEPGPRGDEKGRCESKARLLAGVKGARASSGQHQVR